MSQRDQVLRRIAKLKAAMPTERPMKDSVVARSGKERAEIAHLYLSIGDEASATGMYLDGARWSEACGDVMGAVVLVKQALTLRPKHQAADTPGSPDSIYGPLMVANLEGAAGKIRPLIVDQPGVETLWQGASPPDVASALAAQYRTMEIVRVRDTPQRVSLKSSAAPTTLDAVFDGKEWRLEPAPIIEFRKRPARASP